MRIYKITTPYSVKILVEKIKELYPNRALFKDTEQDQTVVMLNLTGEDIGALELHLGDMIINEFESDCKGLKLKNNIY